VLVIASRRSTAHELSKSATVADFDLPMRALYALAAPSTPPAVIKAVAERSEAGEKLTHAKVKEMFAQAQAEERDAIHSGFGSP
jgi:hypothetical protein